MVNRGAHAAASILGPASAVRTRQRFADGVPVRPLVHEARVTEPVSSRRIGVIDLGSNSGRAVIVEPHAAGHLEIVDEVRARLQLTREIDEDGRLSERGRARTLDAVADFVAVARGAGARRVVAVGTAALRAATNAAELLDEIDRRFGVSVEVIAGDTEARLAFIGAAYGLPVEDGVLVDIGGGSLEMVRFRNRRMEQAWSFPLGALNVTDRFLPRDPPKAEHLAALEAHVVDALKNSGVPRLKRGEHLVGTGGTIRNLAKVDIRQRQYPLTRLHGYVATAARLRRVSAKLASMTQEQRASVPGLNPARADSIVAGAYVLRAVSEHLRAPELSISGQGLREGVVRGVLEGGLPSPESVRRTSVRAFTERLSGWDDERAGRRAALALDLADHLAPDGDGEVREAIEHAATLLDVGASIDFYNRHRESAALVLRTDLAGFSHRHLVQMAAVIHLAERPSFDVRSFRPLLRAGDQEALARAGVVLMLADEIQRRTPPGTPPGVRVSVDGGALHLGLPATVEWRPGEAVERVRKTFGLALSVEGGHP
ncbi:MAG: hypothetical protein GEU80_01220 [Dehalococcoidia bacterium]|nr:hypothetical protein [Dehalococcoidia bacterium]